MDKTPDRGSYNAWNVQLELTLFLLQSVAFDRYLDISVCMARVCVENDSLAGQLAKQNVQRGGCTHIPHVHILGLLQ